PHRRTSCCRRWPRAWPARARRPPPSIPTSCWPGCRRKEGPTMGEELVLRTDAGGVATLTLNRPEKLNALNPAVFIALRDHIDRLTKDTTVGCVVLTGAGRSFCAGHDLGTIAGAERPPSRHFEP